MSDKLSAIAPIVHLSSDSSASEYDVLVVGLGTAGACAAISASAFYFRRNKTYPSGCVLQNSPVIQFLFFILLK